MNSNPYHIKSLNPSFSGCPALGIFQMNPKRCMTPVLIPLLVDVPLWVVAKYRISETVWVLIPLLVDVPLWDIEKCDMFGKIYVLIPLLVDVPLWDIN